MTHVETMEFQSINHSTCQKAGLGVPLNLFDCSSFLRLKLRLIKINEFIFHNFRNCILRAKVAGNLTISG